MTFSKPVHKSASIGHHYVAINQLHQVFKREDLGIKMLNNAYHSHPNF